MKFRLELAKFYFSNNYLVECLAVIDRILEDDKTSHLVRIQFWQGVLNFLIGHYQKSKSLFDSIPNHLLNDDEKNELSFWQGAANIMNSDFKSQHFDWVSNEDRFLKSYTPYLRNNLALLAISDKISKSDFQSVLYILKSVKDEPKTPFMTNNFNYYEARALAALNEEEKAMGIYSTLSRNTGDRKNRQRAIFEIIKHKLKNKKIKQSDAITKLLNISEIWQGDSETLELMKFVADLYLSQGDYFDTMQVWKDILDEYPTSNQVLDIKSKMGNLFTEIMTEEDIVRRY